MSESTIPPNSPDRDLLFGVMAMHLDFINQTDLLLGLKDWGADRRRPLGQVLIERHFLSPHRRILLEEVVEQYLIQHDGDPVRGLVAACKVRTMDLDVEAFASPALRGSLGTLPAAPQTLSANDMCYPPPPSVGLTTSSGKRFRILRPHARGALGEVYLAQDEELNREVALKEIQAPYAANPDSRARFVLEAEITGSLEHPGIVPVYGLGSHPDGRPYYAMRFIRGDSLHDAIFRFHHADVPGRDPSERALALRALLSRFVGVCNAVAYAHSRGVVHRDLKPSNIMLGPFGETLVVDWGLAKVFNRPVTSDSREIAIQPSVLGSARATMIGQAVGTPSFMPPEQAAGRVDQVGQQSDVYSLGATLYNLLTGIPPFPGDDVDEIINQVLLGRQLVPPRKAKRDVPLALEAIVLKAMQYFAADRYQSVNELAQEVERWLADEPVQAYPEPAWQRLQRWTRRHRTLVSGVAVLLLTTLVGLGVGLYAVGREQERTRKNLVLAETNLQLARDAFEQCFLLATEEPLLQQERNQDVRRLLLMKALPFYQKFKSRSPDDSKLLDEEGLNYQRVAFIMAEIGEKPAALQSYDNARKIFSALVQKYPAEQEYQYHLAQVLNDMGNLQAEIGQRPQALASYEEAIRLLEKLIPASSDPHEYQNELASALNNLAVLRRDEDKFDEALSYHRRARDLQIQLAKTYPNNLRYKENLASTQHNLGRFLAGQRDREAALTAYQEARTIREQLVALDLSLPSYRGALADTLHNLGELQREMNKKEEAAKSFKQALDLRSGLARPSSIVPEHHLNLASTLNAIGVLRADDGDFDGAKANYLRALSVQEKLAEQQHDVSVPRYHLELAGTCVNLGNLIRDANEKQRGKLPEALTWYDRAITYLRGMPRADLDLPAVRQVRCNAHQGRADALVKLKKYRDAVADWAEAVRLDSGKDRVFFREQKAFALARSGDHRLAMAEVQDLEKDSTLQGDDLFNLACISALSSSAAAGDVHLSPEERKNRAEENARKALDLLKKASKTDLFKDVKECERLLADSDLKSLRARQDFLAFKTMLLGKSTSR